jgi:hypothetical protein
VSKLFYITNKRGFKNEFYLLQPLRCCIQYTTLFSLRKASAHKKTAPCCIDAVTVAAEAGHAQPSTTLMIYTQQYKRRRASIRNQLSSELYEK